MNTYNDLLKDFVKTYVEDQREDIRKAISYSFKKLTGFTINTEVTDYNRQKVIDLLSNAKIPHCTFADWLRKGGDRVAEDSKDVQCVPEVQEILEILENSYKVTLVKACFDSVSFYSSDKGYSLRNTAGVMAVSDDRLKDLVLDYVMSGYKLEGVVVETSSDEPKNVTSLAEMTVESIFISLSGGEKNLLTFKVMVEFLTFYQHLELTPWTVVVDGSMEFNLITQWCLKDCLTPQVDTTGKDTLTSTTPKDSDSTRLNTLRHQICETIDAYNKAVLAGNQELAQMLYLTIQSLKRQREKCLKSMS